MFDILAGVYSACMIFDIWITRRRVIRWGYGIELNPLAQWLFKEFGADLGTALGIAIPQTVILFLAVNYPHLLVPFAVYCGWRVHRAEMQYRSLDFEKKVVKRMETTAAAPIPPTASTSSSSNTKEN